MEWGKGSKNEVPCVCKNMAGAWVHMDRLCLSVSEQTPRRGFVPREANPWGAPGLNISFQRDLTWMDLSMSTFYEPWY